MSEFPIPDSIEAERALRLQSRSSNGAESEAQLWRTLKPHEGTPLGMRVRAAYQFAKSVDYQHGGLSSAAYLAHPVRVCCMTLTLTRPIDANAATLALLHNLLEVSQLGATDIAVRFGAEIAKAIDVLTVDRTQTHHDYTVQYYRRLMGEPGWVRAVKVFDKLDNLYVLCLNPNEQVRTAYLDDIEEFILPMAEQVLAHLLPHLRLLVADCRRVGYLEPDRNY